MPNRGSPTPAPQTPAGPESERDAARRAAIAALFHRLNGGLNNAALAFELCKRSGDDGGSERTLDRGVAGVEQAARAATLLALIIDPSATRPPSEIGPYAQDVVEILRGHARRAGSTVDPVIATSSLSDGDTPAAAVEALLAGLATLERGAKK